MNTAATQIAQEENSNKWLIIVTIMLMAILEVLDSTIVNVSLPSMMPALGTSQDQITWVLTSYVVASAIMLPLTGFLSNRLGQKRLLITNIIGFMLSSFLCGAAQSLTMMVIFRLLQGAFGASLIPLSQAILRKSFPLSEQGKAMAIWGLGVMVAPVLGPTLGGYITQYANWRWVFYLNMPFCTLALLLAMWVIPNTNPEKQKIDVWGIILMFIGVGSLQLFLDQGNTKDWFDSNEMTLLAVTSIFCLVWFLIRSLMHPTPVIKLSIFANRNFRISTIMLAVFCGCAFAMITLEPIMLETLFRYDTIDAGITMSPFGIASAFGMVLSSQLIMRMNIKYLFLASLCLCCMGAYYLASMNLSSTQHNFFIANAILGFGMGLFMVPLSTYALATVPTQDVTEGSGLFSYGRMLGTSIGISLLSTLVTRETQINWDQMGSHVTVFNPNLQTWLIQTHMHLQNPQTSVVLSQQLSAQAGMAAFLDAYLVIALAQLLLIPLVLLMKSVDLSGAKMGAH